MYDVRNCPKHGKQDHNDGHCVECINDFEMGEIRSEKIKDTIFLIVVFVLVVVVVSFAINALFRALGSVLQ